MSAVFRTKRSVGLSAALVGALFFATSCGSSSIALPNPTVGLAALYNPKYNSSDFTANVTNPWFPLTPGTTLTYEGTKDGEASKDVYTVLAETKTIDGVPTRVVHDSLYLSGKLEEETKDYYTQDKNGNVWYFGEDTKELDKNGNVTSREGSWHAGVDGAKPGVFMEANPVVGHEYRQEYYAGHAEDQYKVEDLSATITVPYGTHHSALRTSETTRLEPGVLDNKFYVEGIGEVSEVAIKGPTERAELVSVTHRSNI
jgi:hypothetical protein